MSQVPLFLSRLTVSSHMRPNTPHVVFTTNNSIVLGAHFYSMSNMQPTFFGIVHCLMGNNLLTNTDHGRTRPLLLRMMQYLYKCLVTGVPSDGEWFIA